LKQTGVFLFSIKEDCKSFFQRSCSKEKTISFIPKSSRCTGKRIEKFTTKLVEPRKNEEIFQNF
jgi:hypothetical protein